ncbi:MAG TPA: L-seryl-tRNA(Sec) selenium transferase [Longimicrobiales bacterium]|nr:L-seryl-tRNA(Sec) selenium transferase [Longimicrobiales bacterium]
MTDPRARIPAIDRLLETPEGGRLLERHPRDRVVEALRAAVEAVRERIATNDPLLDLADPRPYLAFAGAWLARDARPSLRPVINATGVVLHTNLGRAPLAAEARDAMAAAGVGHVNLEYDLVAGERGSRYDHCTGLLRELTGAEDALVVNNCAAALVLAVTALGRGRDVVVSRGELVEIGGGFRIPDVLRGAGARLREVGSTNRTRLEDYEAALRAGGVGAILKVHRSNFRVEGFTEDVGLEELAELGRARGVPVVHDLGSGLLMDPDRLGLPPEPRPVESIRSGTAVVCFSGDKLLGGPQAGLLVGLVEVVSRLRREPLCRALRVDKSTLAGLEATLRLYRDPEAALRRIPVLARLAVSPESLEARCRALAGRLAGPLAEVGAAVEVRPDEGRVGGGTYPGLTLPSWTVRITPSDGDPTGLARRLRSGNLPVVGRIVEGGWAADLRAVAEEEEEEILERRILEAVER